MDWYKLPPLFLLLALVAPSVGALMAIQSSTWNDMDSSLTLDSNKSTCALSGYHRYSWYVLDMGSQVTVNTVTINGKGLKNLFLTVGDNDRTAGSFRGFTNNHDCNIVKEALDDHQDKVVKCFIPVKGRYITMEMLSEEDVPHELNICEFAYSSI